MLKSLKLDGVGPVRDLTAAFGSRLNVLTGDNGLGKSFLLDTCYWSLTGSWPGGRSAIPENGKIKKAPRIEYDIEGTTQQKKPVKTATYEYATQTWTRPKGRRHKPGLVIYASVDGSFSVWDPARNYWRDPSSGVKAGEERPKAFQFTPDTLANGVRDGDRLICNGLLQDWSIWYYQWQFDSSKPQPSIASHLQPFALLMDVVSLISHPSEPMTCGAPKKVYVDQSQTYPVLAMPYGDVAYPQWSAGVRRIVSFAYLLVWTWHEHVQAAQLRNEEPTNRIVLIVDEIEAHLHPKWQRTILPALLEVVQKLQAKIEVQLFAATHSPLILASLETHFDSDSDKLFWFDLREKAVHFCEYPWAIQGDVVGWLTSEIFGLRQARSREGEIAIEAAEAFMRGDLYDLPDGLKTKKSIQAALLKALPGLDPFWPRWMVEVKP